MKPKDQEKATTSAEQDDRKTIDEQKLDSVAGASVPVSIEVGQNNRSGPAGQSSHNPPPPGTPGT